MSPKGSITSEILKCAFEKIDELQIYKRTEQRIHMALFDVHNSRLQVPFLRTLTTQLTVGNLALDYQMARTMASRKLQGAEWML